MLDRIRIRNFKRFEELDIELGDAVLFVGPNNSGKTSVLQALALWQLGIRHWHDRRADDPPRQWPGVTLNRRALVSVPVPDTNVLWHDLRVRDESSILIQIEVDGVSAGAAWTCGIELDHANPESLYCRPTGWERDGVAPTMPPQARAVEIAYLPPMSGLQSNELRLDAGAVLVRIGEGRTAEVLRNLCHRISGADAGAEPGSDPRWQRLTAQMNALFGVTLEPPEYVRERGELAMSYRERGPGGVRLDLSAAGRGLQQTLLLLAYLYANPGAVLLLDEPDAHLEILRQRQIYAILNDTAQHQGCQIIAASHSEVLLNEAADRDVVIAFVGRPHRIDDRGSQVAKSLKAIGFEHYYQAEQKGWVLYLEGATDLAILRSFARTLQHPAALLLDQPFVCYVENQLAKARDHFYGLREAKPDLRGLALVDRQAKPPSGSGELRELMWTRREIENYLCFPEVLYTYAAMLGTEDSRTSVGPLFQGPEAQRFVDAMRRAVEELTPPRALRDPADRWWQDVKAGDDFLDRVFADLFTGLGLPNLMRKTDYHRLAGLVPREQIAQEVVEKLDAIVAMVEGG